MTQIAMCIGVVKRSPKSKVSELLIQAERRPVCPLLTTPSKSDSSSPLTSGEHYPGLERRESSPSLNFLSLPDRTECCAKNKVRLKLKDGTEWLPSMAKERFDLERVYLRVFLDSVCHEGPCSHISAGCFLAVGRLYRRIQMPPSLLSVCLLPDEVSNADCRPAGHSDIG